MSKAKFLLVLLLAAFSLAKFQVGRKYPVDYKLILENPCALPWKNSSIGPNGEMAMCGTFTGEQVAIISSVFETLNATVKDPHDKLYGLPLTPDKVDQYLLEHNGYTNHSILNWSVLKNITKFGDIVNITYGELIDSLQYNGVYPILIDSRTTSPDLEKRWGLLKSVTCELKENNDGYYYRWCHFCAKVNLLNGTETTFCSPPNNATDGYKPYEYWHAAFAFAPQSYKSEPASIEETIALF